MRTILLYLALVGVPTVGVWGIIQLGQRIIPPTSFNGRWDVTWTGQRPDAACIGQRVNLDQPVLTISQSGTFIRVGTHDDSRNEIDGELTGNTVTAQTTNVRVQIDAEAGAVPQHLTGELQVLDCPTQPTFTFAAARQIESQKTVGGH